jgi:hypothetical protein
MAPLIFELRNIMVQTTISSASRRTAGSATAAVLLGAGLACAGNAHAGVETLAPESADTAGVAVPTAIDLTVLPAPTELAALPENPITDAARAAEPAVAEPVIAEPVAEAPARVVPVDKATVARFHPSGDSLEAAMSMATREPEAQVAEARKGMAKWKPVAQARLDESRGGFDVGGGLQVGFGIDRAVFVNGALAVATSITIPNISNITSAQAAQLAQALAPVTVAVTGANSVASAAIAAAQAAAAAAQGASMAGANGAAGSAQGAAGAAASSSAAAATGGVAQATGAAGLAQQAAATATAATGTVVTNGLLTVIQNGAANTANVGAVSNVPATVIQNTLNNQNIQSLMTINASVNTLAAFRSQMANTALNSVIQRMAGMK